MELVLVGLSGSGKTSLGRTIAERHGAELVDLDEQIAGEAGRSIEEIFAADGEPVFRGRESDAIARLGKPDESARLTRVVATGGGAIVEPRNRWRLYRGRRVVWLDATPETLLARLQD